MVVQHFREPDAEALQAVLIEAGCFGELAADNGFAKGGVRGQHGGEKRVFAVGLSEAVFLRIGLAPLLHRLNDLAHHIVPGLLARAFCGAPCEQEP
jgi:hypothetical protein